MGHPTNNAQFYAVFKITQVEKKVMLINSLMYEGNIQTAVYVDTSVTLSRA